MDKYISLGMALQAFIVAYLTYMEYITPTPMQQAIAGAIFLVLFFIRWIFEKRKIL